MQSKDASTAYAARRTAVRAEMLRLEKRLRDTDEAQALDAKNWGYAGDLDRILQLLKEAAR